VASYTSELIKEDLKQVPSAVIARERGDEVVVWREAYWLRGVHACGLRAKETSKRVLSRRRRQKRAFKRVDEGKKTRCEGRRKESELSGSCAESQGGKAETYR